MNRAMRCRRGAVRWVLVLLCGLIGGCHQRELCYDHSHFINVNIRFDWSLEPDADPLTMVVWAFPEDGSQGIRHEFVSQLREGGIIRLPAGSYRMVCFNGSTETNVERGSGFDDFGITTGEQYLLSPMSRQEDAPRPGDTENEPVRSPASRLYAHTHPETLVLLPQHASHTPSHATQPDVTHTVTFTPRRASAVWSVRIEEVRNHVPGIDVSAIVTGASEMWSPRYERPCGAEVTVPFAMSFESPTVLTGQVILMGDGAPHDVRHKLRVYTSQKYYYDYDVTDQVHAAPDPYDVHITLRGLTLPSSGGGMTPGVDDWSDAEDIEIIM